MGSLGEQTQEIWYVKKWGEFNPVGVVFTLHKACEQLWVTQSKLILDSEYGLTNISQSKSGSCTQSNVYFPQELPDAHKSKLEITVAFKLKEFRLHLY